MPSTFAANVVTGKSIDSSGCDIAAVWTMRSTPCSWSVRTSRGTSNSSPWTHVTCGSGESAKSRLKLTTRSPSRARRATRWRPT